MYRDYLEQGRQGRAAARERFVHKASMIAKQESAALLALEGELNFDAAMASPFVAPSSTVQVDSSRSVDEPLTDFLRRQAPVLGC